MSISFQLLGGACFSHGPYTFYKAVRIGNGRVLRLGSFFLTKLWSDADLVSIGELQLLWMDSRGPNQPLASLRLYFLPENTPDGRRDTHGEVSGFFAFLSPSPLFLLLLEDELCRVYACVRKRVCVIFINLIQLVHSFDKVAKSFYSFVIISFDK